MAKTDWGLNDILKPADLNELGGEVNQLREDVDNMDFPLSDATDGTRSDVAGSEKAVGLVMQAANAANLAAATAQAKADQAFTAGNERKQEVVDALIAKGVSASTSDSWDTLIGKMSAIIKATGNATAADVRSGKTFSNDIGNGLIGIAKASIELTMQNIPPGQQIFIGVGFTPSHVIANFSQFGNSAIAYYVTNPVTKTGSMTSGALRIEVSGSMVILKNVRTDSESLSGIRFQAYE